MYIQIVSRGKDEKQPVIKSISKLKVMYETGFERLKSLTFICFTFSPSRHTGFNKLVKFLQETCITIILQSVTHK
jgi:hypothetical protein